MSQDWSKKEVVLIVEDYFNMLQQELRHKGYSKTEHRKAILPLLENRSDGSVEFKHQNISAVLANMGRPYIRGYKPRSNYQQILEEQVDNFLQKNDVKLRPLFEGFANEIVLPTAAPEIDFGTVLEDAPPSSELKEKEPTFRAAKINYLEKEQNNRKLGERGEQFVIEYEKWRLKTAGKAGLANEIEWTSQKRGDGAGYDILSRNIDGSERFVEVKTTKLSKESPIYMSKTEVSFAAKHAANFYLYRVFNFDSMKKLFIRQGEYRDFCHMVPITYKGVF